MKNILDKSGDKKGQMLAVGILMAFLAITFMTAIVPGMTSVIGDARENLNCESTHGDYAYNATAGEESAIACLAIDLYIPYVVLGVLIAAVLGILYGRRQQEPAYSGY